MKNLILVFLMFAPGLLWADTKVLIDAVPTGAEFAGVTPIGLPFKDAEKVNAKDIEAGLNAAVAGILPTGARQGFRARAGQGRRGGLSRFPRLAAPA